MDQYLSTYRKDFIWPYVKTFPFRTSSSRNERALKSELPYRRVPCTCGAEPGGLMPPKEYVGPPDAEAHQWSRLGPMAPLLDPKLYPAKMGPAPEFEISRYDQPNTYLKKLQEKYPYLYNVLQSAPPDDMIRRVNEDRLRSTYQVDYSHMDEHPSADYDKLLAKAGISDWTNKVPCSRDVPAVLDCRANIRPPDYSERYMRRGPDDFANRADGFSDYREVANREGVFGNDTAGYGDSERRNDRGGFRIDDVGFGDFREASNDRGGFRNDAARFAGFREDRNDRGGFRIDTGRYGGSGEAMHDRGGFRNDSRGFEDSREVANRDDGFRGESGRDARPYGDSREVANRDDGFRGESGRDARPYGDSREDANRGGNYKNESGRDPREAGPKAMRNVDGGGGSSGGGVVGKKTDTGGFGSADGDEEKSKRTGKIIDDQDAAKKPLPAWRSEYQEVIGQTGYDIIKDKMHKHGARSRGRSFIERIIMKCRA